MSDPAVRPTAYYIFHVHYKCIVINFQMMTEAELEYFGMLDTGDPMSNRANANAKRTVGFSIVDMAEHLAQSKYLAIVNPDDTVKIYNAIRNHLLYWEAKVKDQLINPNSVPWDDLQKLDRLAEAVFRWSAGRVNRELDDRLLGDLFRRTKGGRPMLKPTKQATENDESGVPKKPTYNSFSDILNSGKRAKQGYNRG